MFDFQVFLPEFQMAADFQAAIQVGALEEKFFYWFPLSVTSWVSLTQAAAYKNANRSLLLIEAVAAQLSDLVPQGFTQVALGPGTGMKDAILAKSLNPVAFIGIDISQMLLEMTLQEVSKSNSNCKLLGVKADFLAENWLKDYLKEISGPAFITILGNTLGFAPKLIAETLQKAIRPGDFLLIDGEKFDHNSTLSGYDHPVNRQFAFSPLASVGISPEDGNLIFGLENDSTEPGLFRVTKHFEFTHNTNLNLGGSNLSISKGYTINMSSSYKYDTETFNKFTDLTHTTLLQRFSSPDGNFWMDLRKA